jgi:hypothetical protein
MKFLDGVLCTLSTRTSATAAGFSRSSKLSSFRIGQAVRTVRAGGMDRPSQHKYHPGEKLSSSQPDWPPCRAIHLAIGLIGSNAGHLRNNIVLSPLHFSASIRNKFREPDFDLQYSNESKIASLQSFFNALEGKKKTENAIFY